MSIKKTSTSILIILILTTAILTSPPKISVSSEQNFDDFIEPAELIIGLSDVPSSYQRLTSLLTECNGKITRTISAHNRVLAFVASVPLTATTSSLLAQMCAAGLVKYIEPNARLKVFQFEPNDPNWTREQYQWAPKKINANWAWNVTLGSKDVLVAVVDTGIDRFHEDLSANYVPLGYNWVSENNDTMDDYGHGTWCSGIIAAEINNGRGIAGLAQVRLMVEKVGDSSGYSKLADIASGIIHAANQSANVISLSLGHYFRSNAVYDAIRYAYEKGVLLVAATGNEDWSGRLYPAAFDEVIAVTGTDSNDLRWYEEAGLGSNYGNWVELAAPGADVYSTWWDYLNRTHYDSKSGTSAAAPHVAGVAALIWSHFLNMSRDQVRVHLRKTAVDLGASGFDEYYGYGRIDANASVSQPPPDHDVLVLNWESPPYVEIGKSSLINATVLNYGTTNEGDVTVQLLINGTVQDSKTISSLASGKCATVGFSWTPWVERDYNISCRVVPVPNEIDVSDNTVWAEATHEKGAIRVPQQFSTIQEAVDVANSGDKIIVANGVYNETVNIYKDFLTLTGENRDETIIDCKDIGGTYGLAIVDVQNVTVSGFSVKRASGGEAGADWLRPSGILLYGALNCMITNNRIRDVKYGGEFLSGIFLASCWFNNSITDNAIENSDNGITIYKTHLPGNIIKGNNISSMYFTGIKLYKALNIVVMENKINGASTGIELYNSTYNVITNNLISGNGQGVKLYNSRYNALTSNQIINNARGINLYGSSNDNIAGNSISGNALMGIWLSKSLNNNISDNIISNNYKGMVLEESFNNTISDNNIKNHDNYGIYLDTSSSNIIYHNNFINNKNQAYSSPGYSNTWDNGYPSGGNYWSDCNGTDQYKGPYQNITGKDGIVDQPYNITYNNIDHYPLKYLWPIIHDVAVIDVWPSNSNPLNGEIVYIYVTVKNEGNRMPETFKVTAYVTGFVKKAIGTQTVTDLPPGNQTTLTFTWNTKGVNPIPEYTISAEAEVVTGETDTADNTYIDGKVKFKWKPQIIGE